MWAIKYHLSKQNKDTEEEEWTSLLSDNIDEDQLNDEEKADRNALQQSQQTFANIFVESWDSIWNDLKQETIKKDAFRTSDFLVRPGTRVATQEIIEARARYYFTKNVLAELRTRPVTALTLDDLQQKIKDKMKAILRDPEALKYAMTEECKFAVA